MWEGLAAYFLFIQNLDAFLKFTNKRGHGKLMFSDGKKASGGLNDIDFILESKVLVNP